MMNRISVFAGLLICLCFSGPLTAAAESSVRLEISGLAGKEGKLHVAVYNSGDAWLGDDAFASLVVDITESTEGELVLADIKLPQGEYAISLFYDANDNGKLDTNFLGIPKEPIALSNNAKGKFGPPKYKDAVFELSAEGLTQRIEIKDI